MTSSSTLTSSSPSSSHLDAPPAIDIHQLTHRYQPNSPPALNNLNLRIASNQIFAILGPNGGGKTTLFRILSTLLHPAQGQISIFNINVLSQPHLARQQLGVVFQSPSLDNELSVLENMLHQGHLYNLRGQSLQQQISSLLNQFNLSQRINDPVSQLSGGLKRRVEIAKALLHHPRLLLLDEPSTGLDPVARQDLWQTLSQLQQTHQMTIILTTHYLEEADRCHQLAILDKGQIVAQNSPTALKASLSGQVLLLQPTPDITPQSLLQSLLPTYPNATLAEDIIRIEHSNAATLLPSLATQLSGKIHSIQLRQPSLDDVFIHLTGRSINHSL